MAKIASHILSAKPESNDEERLLYQFLEAAPTDVRSQTMDFVGLSLTDGDELPETIITKFQRLWDWYWPKLGSTDMKTRPRGGPFGSWFTCKQFPDEWCLERLEQFLEVVPMPELADRIAERLAEFADTPHLEAITRILDRMIRADDEGWRAYVWHRPAKTILQAALQGNDTTRRLATQLIEHLGRRGYVEFGELLHLGADRKQ